MLIVLAFIRNIFVECGCLMKYRIDKRPDINEQELPAVPEGCACITEHAHRSHRSCRIFGTVLKQFIVRFNLAHYQKLNSYLEMQ